MSLPLRSRGWVAAGLLVVGCASPSPAQEAQVPPVPPGYPYAPMSLKPLPERPIPDDPPPHEGALYDFPLTIQPPDLIVVESLEGLPGRNISGEHLVRPDGTISLGFYGDVHVRGLTIAQAKTKIILHLRRHLTDRALGLVLISGAWNGPIDEPGAPVMEDVKPAADPALQPNVPPSPDLKPNHESRISSRTVRPRPTSTRRVVRTAAQGSGPDRPVESTPPATGQRSIVPPPGREDDDLAEAFRRKPLQLLEEVPAEQTLFVEPADSDRVFVEITAHNSRVYFVQGDVGTPGRLPFVGNETVLDALNYAGGFTSQAASTDLHLYRPARGGAPARDYRIDHAAILRGDVRANLQIFSGDRLVVGRNPVVARTVETDRALAPFNSILNAAFQVAITARAIGAAAGDLNGTNQAARDALLRRYYDLLNNFPDGKADRFDARSLLEAPPLGAEAPPPARPVTPDPTRPTVVTPN